MNKRARADQFTLKAKQLGYPARSVFKLEEIQRKLSVIQKKTTVLDIGAAPGSWTLYALRLLGPGGRVRAVDLLPVKITVPAGGNLEFRQGDIGSPGICDFIRSGAPYGCILSDAAPKTTGSRLVDASRSCELVYSVIDLAGNFLGKNGNLVVKIFQGGDERLVLEKLRGFFTEARFFRPGAVRSDSIETYLIGKGYRGNI